MSNPTATALRHLLRDPHAPMTAISSLLDEADGAARRAALLSLSRAQQRALYERAAQSPPLTLDDLVPPSTPPLQPVVHHGLNSLPAFRRFEKHMCRPANGADDGGARLFGFNEGATRRFIGPGYFVATPTTGRSDALPSWAERGGVVVDYFQVPDSQVAAGWPGVVDNSRGLQRFVFRGMRDYLRKVSTHASIGAAFQGEKPFHSWFVLCRD
jgi:hypothetical protein